MDCELDLDFIVFYGWIVWDVMGVDDLVFYFLFIGVLEYLFFYLDYYLFVDLFFYNLFFFWNMRNKLFC